MNRYTLRCAIYLVLIKNDKIFLLRRKNTGWEDGKYSVPGGHLEPNETISQGVKREAKEEAGVDINLKDLKLIHAMHRKSNFDYIDLFFIVNKWKGEPKNAENHMADDGRWFSLDKLPKNILLHQKIALDNYKNKINFSEIGF